MLSDCGLTQDEINRAWDRKEALIQKIEADKAYFADKEPGFTEDGRIRLVKEEEWPQYSLQQLGKPMKEVSLRLLQMYRQ